MVSKGIRMIHIVVWMVEKKLYQTTAFQWASSSLSVCCGVVGGRSWASFSFWKSLGWTWGAVGDGTLVTVVVVS